MSDFDYDLDVYGRETIPINIGVNEYMNEQMAAASMKRTRNRYLEAKWKESGREEMEFTNSVLPLVLPTVPTQINGCDCGVYVLRYAKARLKAGSPGVRNRGRGWWWGGTVATVDGACLFRDDSQKVDGLKRARYWSIDLKNFD